VIETTPGPKRAASEKSRRKIETSQLEDDPLWYKDALIYELHVRAFYDSDADGGGDFRGLRFHFTENEQLLAYSKSTPDNANVILTVVNVDPHHVQRGMVNLPLEELGIEIDRSYQAHELISGARYLWNGPRNFVEVNPQSMPGQIFRFRRRVRSEHDFEYFL